VIPVKVCGITRLPDAQLSVSLGASALGFIFYPPSPRFIPYENAATIARALGDDIAKVGVFVDEEIETVNRVAEIVGLDFVQLHGEEPPEYCRGIERPVIKAMRIKAGFDPASLEGYDVHAFLLDAYVEDLQGGTGQTFDWERFSSRDFRVPVILAGGLNRENVLHAIDILHPIAIDISSGVEQAPGVKDAEKLTQFFQRVRSTANQEFNIFR